MNEPSFWNNQLKAKKVTKEVSLVKGQLDKLNLLNNLIDEVETYNMLIEEDFEESLLVEASEYLISCEDEVDKLEVEFLLNGKFDQNNAILSIHPGAGGLESQDWAEMLLRMYSRWSEKKNFKFEIIDYLAGEEAGLKSVSVIISGDYAYGFLKTEIGVHRLVRISPFNSQGKRQTSFASVGVYAEIDDDIEIELVAKDLKIDTYRASGAGGQHVNTTDSAVRITHLPTNIVSSCQNQRSQLQNKVKAMQILKSRLFQHFEEIKRKERESDAGSKTEIGWGNQIRSYVFHPYQMVKDHRTNFEIGNTDKVMDGGLDNFMNAFLKYLAEKK